jgi:hypothetical protein
MKASAAYFNHRQDGKKGFNAPSISTSVVHEIWRGQLEVAASDQRAESRASAKVSTSERYFLVLSNSRFETLSNRT